MDPQALNSKMVMPLAVTTPAASAAPTPTAHPHKASRRPLVDRPLFEGLGRHVRRFVAVAKVWLAAAWQWASKLQMNTSQVHTLLLVVALVYFVRTAASTVTAVALAALAVYALSSGKVAGAP